MNKIKSGILCAALLGGAFLPLSTQATVVRFQTSMGSFDVNLFDSTAPKTVANFLDYVRTGAYDNTVIHRSVFGFIVQGGGYQFDDAEKAITPIDSFDPVENEPNLSNLKGTIAMAKLSGDPDSATNQWFFNLSNNSANLDNQNGGFTPFGVVMGDGMKEVLYPIEQLRTYYLSSAASDIPLIDPPETISELESEHFVVIESVTIVDTTTDTHLELLPDESKPTIDFNRFALTNRDTPFFNGQSTNIEGQLTLSVESQTYPITPGEAGAWEFRLPAEAALEDGIHTATITGENASGATVTESHDFEVEYKSSVQFYDLSKVTTATPLLSGIGFNIEGEVSVAINGLQLTAEVQSDGSWQVQVPAEHTLENGTYTATVSAQDTKGQNVTATDEFEVEVVASSSGGGSLGILGLMSLASLGLFGRRRRA